MVFVLLIFLDPHSKSRGKPMVKKIYRHHLWTHPDWLGDGRLVKSA
jgi:hypothetical protein